MRLRRWLKNQEETGLCTFKIGIKPHILKNAKLSHSDFTDRFIRLSAPREADDFPDSRELLKLAERYVVGTTQVDGLFTFLDNNNLHTWLFAQSATHSYEVRLVNGVQENNLTNLRGDVGYESRLSLRRIRNIIKPL
jgi:hypothetical protein